MAAGAMPEPMVTRLPPQSCPGCARVMDAHASNDAGEPDAVPRPGDWTQCLRCGVGLVFLEDYQVRMLSEDEELALPREVKRAFRKVRRFIRVMGGG